MGVHITIPVSNLQLTGHERKGAECVVTSKTISNVLSATTDIEVAAQLGITQKDIYKYLTVELGQTLEEGDVVARKKKLFGKKEVRSPGSGEVRKIDHQTGVISLSTLKEAHHTFSITGIWHGVQGENADIELKHAVTLPVQFALPVSFSGEVTYIPPEEEIDNKIVVTAYDKSQDIARLCAFDPIAIVSPHVGYFSRSVYQLAADVKELEECMKKKHERSLYLADSKVIYFYE